MSCGNRASVRGREGESRTGLEGGQEAPGPQPACSTPGRPQCLPPGSPDPARQRAWPASAPPSGGPAVPAACWSNGEACGVLGGCCRGGKGRLWGHLGSCRVPRGPRSEISFRCVSVGGSRYQRWGQGPLPGRGVTPSGHRPDCYSSEDLVWLPGVFGVLGTWVLPAALPRRVAIMESQNT